MERLTKHSKQTSHENGICCTHFLGPECLGVGGNCAMNCKWEEAAWSRLAAYEDTGLTPEKVLPKDKADEIALKLMRLADLENICSYNRLRELAKADKDGRLVVLPCKVGDKLYRVFAGEIFEHRVGSMKYFAIQGRWDIETYPFCPCVESSIGKTIFLTREEAEKALEAMK
nr:MAG TPA: hypothetical protein [Caudoviricetes sp.]